MTCTKCKGERFTETTGKVERRVGATIVSANVRARRCARCGEIYFDASDLDVFDNRVAELLARFGVASGDAFKFMRKSLPMKASELAALLGVADETISRWETNKRAIDRSAVAVLAGMVLDRTGKGKTIDILKALQKPKKLPKRIDLGKREAS